MKNLYVNVSRETRMVNLPKQFIAVEGENLQSKLIFTFIDEFVDGQARLEYEINGEKNYVLLNKEDNIYSIPVKNVITKEGQIDMQLVITEGTNEEEIPVFKSNKFYLYCNSSINAVNEAPEGYDLWIEQANVKLNQFDNIDIDLKDNVLTITKKDGTKISENVKGDPGVQGKPGSVKTIPVNEFPTENIQTDAIYILPNPDSKDEKDKYLEYVYINNDWELFGGGSVGVNLDDYATKKYVDDLVTNIDVPEIDQNDVPIILMPEIQLPNWAYVEKTYSNTSNSNRLHYISETITHIYEKGYTDCGILVKESYGQCVFYPISSSTSSNNFNEKKTTFVFTSVGFPNVTGRTTPAIDTLDLIGYMMTISGKWTDDIFTCTQCKIYRTTPFAKKSYVDDAIANAGSDSGIYYLLSKQRPGNSGSSFVLTTDEITMMDGIVEKVFTNGLSNILVILTMTGGSKGNAQYALVPTEYRTLGNGSRNITLKPIGFPAYNDQINYITYSEGGTSYMYFLETSYVDKSYVDNAIKSAITTTLEGSY